MARQSERKSTPSKKAPPRKKTQATSQRKSDPWSVDVHSAYEASLEYKGEEVVKNLKWNEAVTCARILNETEAVRQRIDNRTH